MVNQIIRVNFSFYILKLYISCCVHIFDNYHLSFQRNLESRMYRYIIKADFGLLVNIDIKHHSHQNLNLNLQNSI